MRRIIGTIAATLAVAAAIAASATPASASGQFRSYHTGGLQAVFVDGSVR
jgi:prepilin-type processing-associated H-X9-DG protein